MNDRQTGRRQTSRRAGLRSLPTPTDAEIIVADGPPLLAVIDDLGEPRIAELDALLREVDSLRSTMRRDFTLAATAVEAGDADLAGWLLLGEDGQVRAFEERALGHLDALERASVQPMTEHASDQPNVTVLPVPRRRAPRMLAAAPLVAAAAAVIGVLTGVVPGTGGTPRTSSPTANAALQSYAQLAELASTGASASRISAAAERFHADLAPLVAAGGSNPAATEKAIAMLQSERAVIAGEADSPALRAVLAQADALVLRLQAALSRRSAHQLVTVAPAPQGDQRHAGTSSQSSPAAQPSPSPSTAAAPKPTPKPSPSAAQPASSQQPSASPSSTGPIPAPPGSVPG